MTSSISTPVHPTQAIRAHENVSEQDISMPYLGAAVPVGLVGAGAVAAFVLILDALAGHPLGTPNALGAALLRGEGVPLNAAIQPGLVFGYTLLHAAAFIVVATAAVSAEFTLDRAGVPASVQIFAGVIGLLVGLTAIMGALFSLLEIPWVGGFERILTVNAIAALSMAISVHLRGERRREQEAALAGR